MSASDLPLLGVGGAVSHYLSLPSTGYLVSTPHTSAMNPGTTPLDLRANMAFDDWTPSGDCYGLMVYNGSVPANGQYGLYLHGPTGLLVFTWYAATGGAQQFAISSAAVGVADGTPKWIRSLMTFTAGTCQFFVSDDGTSWTALGSTQTGLNTTGVRVPASPARLTVASGDDAAGEWTGKVYRAQLIVNSATICDIDFTLQTPGATSFAATTGETWTLASPAAIV